jgi:hypothetical protein|eukprot:COSAG06_NODE_12622_length_1353_cov_1.185805_2_plen_71_part_00
MLKMPSFYQDRLGTNIYRQKLREKRVAFSFLQNESENLYYSYDTGLIHFVSYNTEVYFNMTGACDPAGSA